jgi:AraC-like DNA-binding protein
MKDFFHLSLNRNPPGCRNADAAHAHDYHQLLYFTSGEGLQSADGWQIPLRAGDLLFVPIHTEHRSVFPPGKRSECFVLDFHGDLFTPALPGDKEALEVIDKMAWFRGKVPLSAAGAARLRPIFDELLVEFQRKEPAYRAGLKMMLMRILIVVARDEEFRQRGMPICPPPSHAQMIREVIHYLGAAYMKTVTVESVLEFCPLSRSHFHAVFKQTTGKTFVAYLTAIRLKKAKEELAGSNTPVADIATMVGFGTSSYFGQLFRSATGLSPGRYRERFVRRRRRASQERA